MSFTYRVLLKPIDICFNKKLLPSSFDDGIPLRKTLQQLANGEILLEDLPIIDVVWCQKKWVWYTLNNRRLWVFRELEKLGKCQYIATRRVESFERVTNYIVYGSAELIGESTTVEWDEDDGQKSASSDGSGSKATTDKRNWREVTPLMVTVRWNDLDKGDADDKSMVTADPDEHSLGKQQVEQDDGNPDETDESQRERNDSGYYPSSSGRTSPRDLSDNETEYETVFSETESSEESKSSGRRFNRFESDRPQVATCTPSAKLPSRSHVRSYSVPPSRKRVFKTSTRKAKPSRRPRTVYSLIASESLRALMFRRRDIHDRLMFTLHHGRVSRLEQHTLKTKLMNTCGFCFKSFRARVSLSQHVEELKHWACIRCGKYFESYTALGQHKLALDHCNVY